MKRDGVTLLAGTDLAAIRIPGFFLHEELATLVEAGLTPREALDAATRAPAAVLGREKETGAVRAGCVADLVLLDADPLQDIHNTQRIAAVVANGVLWRRADLDALLARGARLAERN